MKRYRHAVLAVVAALFFLLVTVPAHAQWTNGDITESTVPALCQASFATISPSLSPQWLSTGIFKNSAGAITAACWGTITEPAPYGKVPYPVSIYPSCSGGLGADFYTAGGCSPVNGNMSPKSPGNPTCPGTCSPDPHLAPGKRVAGDPIDIGSGNVSYETTDYTTAGQNPLKFTRYYNSRILSAGELGMNWRSTYDAAILVVDSTNVIVMRPNGQSFNFSYSGSGWTTDSDVDYTLTGSSTLLLTCPDDTVETYVVNSAATNTTLTSIKSRNGYTQTLNYTSGVLSSVTDSYDRTLTININSDGLLTSITTPDSTTIDYTFNGTNVGALLTSVTFPTSPATSVTYAYGANSAPFNALTSIVDEDGNTYATWTYDAYGRGLTDALGGSSLNADKVTVAYNDSTRGRTVTNAFGVVDTYSFTVLQNVPKVSGISRAATSTTAAATEAMTYDSNGYLASLTDWNGNQTTYTNNSHGMPTTINEAVGSSVARTTTIAYDPTWVHLPDTITTPGVTISFTYDGSGETLTRELADTTTTSVPYSTNGQTRTWTNTWSNYLLASVKTPNGNTTTLGYDSTGALTSVTNALSQETRITSHTGGGLPETIVDPNSITTTLAYDARQRLTSKAVSASGATTLTTTYTVDPTGEITKFTPPDNAYISYTYDTAHRITKLTNALGEYDSLTLDALGDITQNNIYSSSGALNRQHSGVFDALGRITEDIGGVSGENTYFTYDPNGNQLTVKDPNSHTTTNVFDALNRLHTSTDANSGVTTFAYDAHDRQLTVTDANSHATSYVYDGFGDAIQQTSPDSGTLVAHYDGDANLTQTVDALSVTTNYVYDALDRYYQRYIPSTNSYVTYSYDASGGVSGAGIGKLTTVSDSAGYVNLHYNPLSINDYNIRYNYSNVQLNAVYYSIDSYGRIQGYQYPSGMYMGYNFDAAGNINQVSILPPGYNQSTPAQTVEWPAYGAFSGPVGYMTFGNSIGEDLLLDYDYRVSRFQVSGTAGNLTNQTYSYDNASNLTGVSDTVSAANNQTLGYDVINRLTSAVSGTGGYGSYSWTYDKVGNRLTQTYGTTTTNYSYTSGTNRLSAIGSTSVTTNANGNITSIPPANSSSAATFTYNSANRLASVTGSPTAANFVYDGWNRRYSKTPSGSNAINYIYDPFGNLIEEQNGSYVTDYIYSNGRPVGLFVPTGTSGGTLYFVHTDRQGTPQFVTDINQNVVWKTTYQPFGTTGLITSSLTTQNKRFPGQSFDVETGFYQNVNRDYMPNLGRYLETDPIGLNGGMNTYAYANGNPAKYVDRQGLLVFTIGGGASGGNGISVSGGQGWVFDDSGNIGTYSVVGAGGADIGWGSITGINFQVLGSLGNDTTGIGDMGGPFVEGGIGGGQDGLAGSGSAFMDPNTPNHIGIGITVGPGTPGLSGGFQTTHTIICPKGTWRDLYNSAIDGTLTLIQLLMDAYGSN